MSTSGLTNRVTTTHSRLTDIENVNVHQISDLHAKAVVTEKYVYVGSANITRGGY